MRTPFDKHGRWHYIHDDGVVDDALMRQYLLTWLAVIGTRSLKAKEVEIADSIDDIIDDANEHCWHDALERGFIVGITDTRWNPRLSKKAIKFIENGGLTDD